MSEVRGIGNGNAAAPATGDARAALRRAAHQFEGVFLDQLFQAMRRSVPDGGFLQKSEGEEMFTSMLDQRLADLTAQRAGKGPGEALYRQLCKRLDAAERANGGQQP